MEKEKMEKLIENVKKSVEVTLTNKCNALFSKDPEHRIKNIIEYNGRLRVVPLEKFNAPCFISVINIFKSENDLKNDDVLGALALYIEEELAKEFLNTIDKGKDEEDAEIVMGNTGELCQSITEELKKNLVALGHNEVVFSPPENYKNSVPGGVKFSYSEKKMVEVDFWLKNEKNVAVDFTFSTK